MIGRTCAALLLLALCTGLATPSLARMALPPMVVEVPHIIQQTEKWCWLAVAEMALRFRYGDEAPRQCEMLEVAFNRPPGSCCDDNTNCIRGGTMVQIKKLIDHYSDDGLSLILPPESPEDLYGQFMENKLIIAQLLPGPEEYTPENPRPPGHAIVLRGMVFRAGMTDPNTGRAIGQYKPMVIVNDPARLRPITVPFEYITRHWGASILVD